MTKIELSNSSTLPTSVSNEVLAATDSDYTASRVSPLPTTELKLQINTVM